MKNIKLFPILISLSLLLTFLTACKKTEKAKYSESDISETSQLESAPVTETATEPVTTAVTYPEYPVTYPAIIPQDTGDVYQAEDCPYDGLTFYDIRAGHSGTGYVSGFDGNVKSLSFAVNAPSTQHYDVGFSIAAETEITCSVEINGKVLGEFKTDKSGKFTLIKMYGIFLTQGASDIKITAVDGNIDLDYLQLTNNTSLSEISYEADGSLSNDKAAKNAAELMAFLTENYGKSIISGQYVSSKTNSELDFIYKITGKYPAIRFASLDTSYMSMSNSFEDIDAAVDWYRNGGIVGLMWQWNAPSDTPSVYADETDFRLSRAVTDQDIALLSQEDIRGLFGEGKISEECYGLILDIDNMAGQLTSLKNKGIPVLWRPLHEASGGWFWWGADGAADYKWLWELMYNRMTDYFGLDNLIWVWNGQGADYLVDEDMYDIASVDIYMSGDKEYGSRYEQFVSVQKMIGKDKLIALSECSRLPDIDSSFRDNAVWSFFGVWYGSYLTEDGKEFSEKYITRDAFIRAYNSEGVMTLDEYSKFESNGNTPFLAVTTTTTNKTAETTSRKTQTVTTTVSTKKSQ